MRSYYQAEAQASALTEISPIEKHQAAGMIFVNIRESLFP